LTFVLTLDLVFYIFSLPPGLQVRYCI